jgi:hypothetical protein
VWHNRNEQGGSDKTAAAHLRFEGGDFLKDIFQWLHKLGYVVRQDLQEPRSKIFPTVGDS